MSWTCEEDDEEEEEEEEDSWFNFWVPGTPLVCFQWLPPEPLCPPNPLYLCKYPFTPPQPQIFWQLL